AVRALAAEVDAADGLRERQQVAVVLEQHQRLPDRLPAHGPVLGRADGGGEAPVDLSARGEQAHHALGEQDPADLVVEAGLGGAEGLTGTASRVASSLTASPRSMRPWLGPPDALPYRVAPSAAKCLAVPITGTGPLPMVFPCSPRMSAAPSGPASSGLSPK